MTKWTHVKSRQRSAAGVNISSKKRKAKTDREYQQRQKQIRELERRHKPLKIKLKRCDINRVRSKETIDDNIERITQLINTNNDAMDMDINDVPICDAEIQFTQSTQPTDIRWTMSKRTTDTANIKDYSVSFADVLRDKQTQIDRLKRKYERTQKQLNIANMEVNRLICEFIGDDTSDEDQSEYIQQESLSIGPFTDVSILNTMSFEPDFVAGFYEFIKIRLKVQVLRNSYALTKLQNILDMYTQIIGRGTNLELGGTSDGTINRVMQFKSQSLFQSEVCVMFHLQATSGSVISLYHDECSQRGESQESIVLAFDCDPPREYEYEIQSIFTPKLLAGNVVRGIWHRNIPAKDAATTVKWSVQPAIEQLDSIGKRLFESWTSIASRMKERLAVMSDQNSTALLTNKLIG
eukprot:934712_1